MVFFVDGVWEEYAGGTVGGCPGEGDTEAANEEHLVDPLKIAIVWLQSDGAEGVAQLMESGGDICDFGHGSDWGGERGDSRPVFFLLSDLV